MSGWQNSPGGGKIAPVYGIEMKRKDVTETFMMISN